MAKVSGSSDTIAVLDSRDNTKRVLPRRHRFADASSSQADGRSYAVNIPVQDRWHVARRHTKGSPPIQNRRNARYPLMPLESRRFNRYFAESDLDERFHIFRVAATGGTPENISPISWNWGEADKPRDYQTKRAAATGNYRSSRRYDDVNHPLLPDSGWARFDGQNGQVFFLFAGRDCARSSSRRFANSGDARFWQFGD